MSKTLSWKKLSSKLEELGLRETAFYVAGDRDIGGVERNRILFIEVKTILLKNFFISIPSTRFLLLPTQTTAAVHKIDSFAGGFTQLRPNFLVELASQLKPEQVTLMTVNSRYLSQYGGDNETWIFENPNTKLNIEENETEYIDLLDQLNTSSELSEEELEESGVSSGDSGSESEESGSENEPLGSPVESPLETPVATPLETPLSTPPESPPPIPETNPEQDLDAEIETLDIEEPPQFVPTPPVRQSVLAPSFKQPEEPAIPVRQSAQTKQPEGPVIPVRQPVQTKGPVIPIRQPIQTKQSMPPPKEKLVFEEPEPEEIVEIPTPYPYEAPKQLSETDYEIGMIFPCLKLSNVIALAKKTLHAHDIEKLINDLISRIQEAEFAGRMEKYEKIRELLNKSFAKFVSVLGEAQSQAKTAKEHHALLGNILMRKIGPAELESARQISGNIMIDTLRLREKVEKMFANYQTVISFLVEEDYD